MTLPATPHSADLASLEALVLAGGLGRRLQDMPVDGPKPMVEIAGRPFLELLLKQLQSVGLRKVILAVGYRGERVAQCFGDGRKWGLALDYSWETSPLGTAGALRQALGKLTGASVLVLNGDSFVAADYAQLLSFHATHRESVTLTAVYQTDCRDFGQLELGAGKRVVAFREKPVAGAGAGYVNAGVYVFGRSAIEKIPAGKTLSLERDFLPSLLREEIPLYAWVVQGYFKDLGTPERVEEFRRDFTEKKIPLRVHP